MIEIENLNFSYKNGTQALHDINLTFDFAQTGQSVALLGTSGSGKTTLLNCIGRFLTPSSGRILLHRQNISEMNTKQFRQQVGIVFQDLSLFPHMTVAQNLMLALTKVKRQSTTEAAQRARAILAKLNLDSLYESYPAQLSGGQAQRVAIARGLVLEPEILLLDEPTAALDINTTREFARWLRELHESTNFVIVTHDVAFAHDVADHAALMEKGRVTVTGEMQKIMKIFTAEHPGAVAGP
ncbi:MAG: ATP-binding cassette domain-containing protein [Chitinivibrionales bacterium]|nr:ATP-binding cassette domain-containing protein [Chitinivibrionales bacterium]